MDIDVLKTRLKKSIQLLSEVQVELISAGYSGSDSLDEIEKVITRLKSDYKEILKADDEGMVKNKRL